MRKFQNVNFDKLVALKVAHKNNNKNFTRASAMKIENFIVKERQHFRLTYKVISYFL
jgi:hypothetical protein